MAGLYTCRNFLFGSKDELVGAPTEGNSTFSPFLVLSQAQTPTLT